MSEVKYELKGPAQEDGVLRLQGQYPNLSADYFSFLLRSDGGEGFVGVSPGYFCLWSAHDVANFSSEYQVHIYLPGYVAIGSSGGVATWPVLSPRNWYGSRLRSACLAQFFGVRRGVRKAMAPTCITIS